MCICIEVVRLKYKILSITITKSINIISDHKTLLFNTGGFIIDDNDIK